MHNVSEEIEKEQIKAKLHTHFVNDKAGKTFPYGQEYVYTRISLLDKLRLSAQ
jgi:hypothetical protein